MIKMNFRPGNGQKESLEYISRQTDNSVSKLLRMGADCVIEKYSGEVKIPQNILVVGGTGYIGKAFVQHQRDKGRNVTVLKTDLTNSLTLRQDLDKLDDKGFDVGYNLAADVGGIGYTSTNQLDIFYNNFIMIKNYFEYIYPICDFTVQTSSACIYPSNVEYPTTEKFIGSKPDKQVLGYGAAKLLMTTFGNILEEANVNTLILTNVYGEYLNSCESFGEKSHAIAALIEKFYVAKKQGIGEVHLWGDGSQTRDFVHVEDVVNALDLAAIKPRMGIPDGFNIANGVELSIKSIALKIAKIIGFEGSIVWDTTKPTGVKRRWLSTSKAETYLGWNTNIYFDTGLENEVNWYVRSRNA